MPVLLAIGALVLGACTGSSGDAPNDETAGTDGTNAETDAGSGSEREIDPEILTAIDAAPIPDRPAGDQLRFVLESIQPNGVPSAAKLYVLHAVATAVEAGEIAWEDEVTLTEADRSLPSGVLQDEPTGTTRTVAQLATGMIEISDNTATDHLTTLVGRDAVEAAVVDAGHADPSLLAPYLRTREAFAIGWDDDRRQAWAEADTSARRELLADLPDGTGGVAVDDLVTRTEPVWPDDVDWFASMSDVCGVHAALDLDDPTVAEAVGTNPGLALDASLTRPAFKGGSVHGVLALSWSVDAPDGDRWFVGVALNDPEEPVDELAAFGITERLLELLADRVG